MDIQKEDGTSIIIDDADINYSFRSMAGAEIHVQSFELDKIYKFLKPARFSRVRIGNYYDGTDFSGHYTLKALEKDGETLSLELENLK